MNKSKSSSGSIFGSGLLRSKSQPSITSYRMEEQLKQLKPSKELLYYRKKMAHLAKEYQEVHETIEMCRKACERDYRLQQELQRRQYELSQLQETISDLQVYLYQEREQVLRLYAENDRLKICLAEDRKKIQFLLSLTSTTENELAHFIGQSRTPVVHQTLSPNTGKTKTGSKRDAPSTLTAGISRDNDKGQSDIDLVGLQNKALAVQLEEQTRLFEDHFQTLLRDRELHCKEALIQHEQYQEKIFSLSTRLKETRTKLCDTVKQILEVKEQHCRNELMWAAERDVMKQNMQNIQSPPGPLGPFSHRTIVSGGGCMDQKSCYITKAELDAVKEELTQREKVVAMYQEQCVLLEEEVTNLRLQVEASKKAFKERSQKLLDLISALKRKYSELDRRRRLEAEGFRSDVRLMRSRLREVERSLLRLARGTATLSAQNVEQEIILSVADTVSKAQLLGEELQNIHKKVSKMDTKQLKVK